MHALGERSIVWRHLRNLGEEFVQAVGLLGALLALGAQLGRAFLHRSTLLGAEAVGFFRGLLRGHSRQSFRCWGSAELPTLTRTVGPTAFWCFSIPDRSGASRWVARGARIVYRLRPILRGTSMPAPTNAFKRRLLERDQQIGLFTTLNNPAVIEVLAGCGFDWILIDCEHSPSEVADV